MRSFVVCLLFAAVSAITEVAVEDSDVYGLVNDSGPASKAATAATSWIYGQRHPETAWGPFTPRAVTALMLAKKAGLFLLPEAEGNILAKQLNVMLSIEVGSDADGRPRQMGISRLAQYVNALRATCQNPRRFHGLDLVGRLREETNKAVQVAGDSFPRPLVFLALCLAGEATHGDLTRLSKMYTSSVSKIDMQSLYLLAMSCITGQQQFASTRPIFSRYLREFASRIRALFSTNSTDVYTKALAIQALHSGGVSELTALPSLLSEQLVDGSFERSLLATYHAVPALMGSSLLALADPGCDDPLRQRAADGMSSASRSSPVPVQLSLWIGENADDRDTHSVTVLAGTNDTLLDVMRKAEDKNDIFRFKYDTTPSGVQVYSIAGIPNDSEREVHWRLWIQSNGRHQRMHRKNQSVDKIFPQADDRIVFWFKRDSFQ